MMEIRVNWAKAIGFLLYLVTWILLLAIAIGGIYLLTTNRLWLGICMIVLVMLILSVVFSGALTLKKRR